MWPGEASLYSMANFTNSNVPDLSRLLAYLQMRCIPSSYLWFVALLDKCSGGNCNEPQNSTEYFKEGISW